MSGLDAEVAAALLARGWRAFSFGDRVGVVLWDPEEPFLATVPPSALTTAAAVARAGAPLRSAFAPRPQR